MKKMKCIKGVVATMLFGLGLGTQIAFASDVAEDSAQQFPDPKHSYMPEGDFVNPQSVARMNQGLTKDQVALLLSNPHFSEGMNALTWNYLFNFYVGSGKEYIQCQYQVKFDNKGLVEQTAWRTGQCADLVNPQAKPVIAKMTLAADGLFAFGKGRLADMDSAGVQALDGVVEKIKSAGHDVRQITITGFTDRFGSQQSNETLSRQRAQSVKDHLVAKGINAALIKVVAKGSTEPVVYCAGPQTPSVIDCLKPNRRVSIVVE